jgi:hypothetical protein
MKANVLSQLGRRARNTISWLVKQAPHFTGRRFTDNGSLPVVVRGLLRDPGMPGNRQAALQYGDTGDRMLRRLTARRLQSLDGQPAVKRRIHPIV